MKYETQKIMMIKVLYLPARDRAYIAELDPEVELDPRFPSDVTILA